jgi:hypothetical protein
MRLVKQYFQEIGYNFSIDEVIDESGAIYEGFRQITIGRDTDQICNELREAGLSYWYMTVSEKIKLYAFRIDDNNYNLALHLAVLKKLEVEMDFDERYEDYKKVMKQDWKIKEKIGAKTGGDKFIVFTISSYIIICKKSKFGC